MPPRRLPARPRDDTPANLLRYTDDWSRRNALHITKRANRELSRLYGKSVDRLRAVQSVSDASVVGWLNVLERVRSAQDELHRQLLAQASGGRVTEKTLKSVLSSLCPGFWPFC